MERKEIKWAVTLFLGVIFGILTFWVWRCSPTEYYVEVRAEQIAKRLETTRSGDRFYLLFDTKYGLMENRVSYAKYISSSNGRIAIFNLSLAEYDSLLDNPQAMEKEYPAMKYYGYYLLGRILSALVWFILVIWGTTAWVEYKQSGDSYDQNGKYTLVVASGILFGFVLYLIA